MNKLHFLFAVILGIGCTQNQEKNSDPLVKTADTIVEANKATLDENNISIVIDTLNKEEIKFLSQLSKENESLLIHEKVERYYSLDNKNSPLYSKMIIPEAVLQAKGYVYFDLTANGRITDANFVYNYSRGQASTGSGSIIGANTTDYVHTIKSCGVTACIIQVFQNGVKIFEKDK